MIVLQILSGILASMVVAWFSCQREFRADAGGAHLAGKRKMIAALEGLQGAHGQSTLPENMNAFGISGGKFAQMFSSHPPLDVRIATLQRLSQYQLSQRSTSRSGSCRLDLPGCLCDWRQGKSS